MQYLVLPSSFAYALAMHILRQIYLIPIYIYKGIISPFSGPSCRYSPSCSSYFLEAVLKFGIAKGSIMGLARIGRCRNAFFGGPDPVPDVWSWKEIKKQYKVRRKPRDFDRKFKTS